MPPMSPMPPRPRGGDEIAVRALAMTAPHCSSIPGARTLAVVRREEAAGIPILLGFPPHRPAPAGFST
jgi:hypothetical protein